MVTEGLLIRLKAKPGQEDQVANFLDISRATAYGYLNEIQAKRDASAFADRARE